MATKLIKTVCTVLVFAVLILGTLLTVTVRMGLLGGGQQGHFTPGGGISTPLNVTLQDILDAIKENPDLLVGDLPSPDGVVGGDIGMDGQYAIMGALGAAGLNVPVMNIEGEPAQVVYLKQQSFGDYTGTSWNKAVEYDKYLAGGYSADYLRGLTCGGRVNEMTVEPIMPVSVMPYYISTDGDSVYTSDTVVSGSTSAPYTVYYHYGTSASSSKHASDAVADYEYYYHQFVKSNYLLIDSETNDYMQSIIQSRKFNAKDADIVGKVARYISGAARYDFEYDKSIDSADNVAIAFLEAGEGIASHYASAATLMYRALGIPARYTTGYAVELGEDGAAQVTFKNSHAWVEVYEEGYGWRQVDASGIDTSELGGTGGGSGAGGGLGGGGGQGSEDILVFSIFSEYNTEDVYLKSKSFADYTGSGWTDATPYGELIAGSYSADYLRSFTTEVTEKNFLQIYPHTTEVGLPYYARPLGDFGQQSDVLITGNAFESYEVMYSKYNRTQISSADTYFYERDYHEYVTANYLNIDTETLDYMMKIIIEQKFDPSDPDIIEKVAKYIQGSAVYNLDYDQSMDAQSNVVISFLRDYKQGVCRHYAASATLLYRALGIPARYTVGYLASVSAGETVDVYGDRAHAWVEVYEEGLGWRVVEVTGSDEQPDDPTVKQVTLKPRDIVVSINDQSIIDAYAQLSGNSGLEGFEKYAAMGYYYSVTVLGEQNGAGVSNSRITTLAIYDRNGNNVTGEFEIKTNPGKLQIYLAELGFESVGAQVTYNGKAQLINKDNIKNTKNAYYLAANGYEVTYIPLAVSGASTSNTNVGIYDAKFRVKISKNGVDCTSQFKIDYFYGDLEIKPLSITLTPEDKEMVYDGEHILRADSYILSGTLAEGHRIGSLTFLGEQKYPGVGQSSIQGVVIYDSHSNNVTSNYSIKTGTGKLTVTYPG